MGTQQTPAMEGRAFWGGTEGNPLTCWPRWVLQRSWAPPQPLGMSPWGDPVGIAWPLDKGRVLLPGLGTPRGVQSHFQNKKERDLGACNPLMSITPPSKNHGFPPCPTTHHLRRLTWAPENPSSPRPQGHMGTQTAPAPPASRTSQSQGRSQRLPAAPLADPFPHRPQVSGNSSLLGSWKKWLVWLQFG